MEAEKEVWHNKFVADAANNNFKYVGTLKYINLLLHTDIHFQCIKYIINEQSMNRNVFLLFFSFVFSLSSNWERERERVYKIGYKEKQSQSYLSYLDGFLWRIFLLLRADRLYLIFLVLVRRYFSSSFTRSFWVMFRPPRTLSNN